MNRTGFLKGTRLKRLSVRSGQMRARVRGEVVKQSVCLGDLCVCQKSNCHRLSPEGKYHRTDSRLGFKHRCRPAVCMWVSDISIKGCPGLFREFYLTVEAQILSLVLSDLIWISHCFLLHFWSISGIFRVGKFPAPTFCDKTPSASWCDIWIRKSSCKWR